MKIWPWALYSQSREENVVTVTKIESFSFPSQSFSHCLSHHVYYLLFNVILSKIKIL